MNGLFFPIAVLFTRNLRATFYHRSVTSSKQVLVVDDEPSIRSLYQLAFSHKGYDVQVCATAEEALELLAEREVDVLFADLNLPGMNGLELGRLLQERFPGLYKIAITGNLMRFGPDACRAAGFHKVLSKPISLENLLNAAESRPPSSA